MQLPDCLHGLDVVGLDWETFYDKSEYDLKKLSTSLYVRDERFQAHTVGIRKPRWHDAKWFKGRAIARELAKIDWSRTALLCHHTQFDGLILSHHYGITPAFYLDTLSMARALHGNQIDSSLDTVARFYGEGNKLPDVLEQLDGVHEPSKEQLEDLGNYNATDVDIMWRVFWRMIENGYPDEELRLIDLTVSLFTEPVLSVDRDLAEAERIKWRDRKHELLREVIHYDQDALAAVREVMANAQARINAGKKPRVSYNEHLPYDELISKIIKSNDRFAEMLRKHGVAPPTKPSPSDHSQRIYAFAKNDLDFQALQSHPEPKVQKLVNARLVAQSNINETRAEGLLARSEGEVKLPVYLNYCGAHTMRWSGGDKLNPQNFPDPAKGTDSRLRECLVAPRGMRIVVVDSGQIEARVVAWLFKQWDKLEAFADPQRDPYCEFASDLYRYRVTKKETPTERFVGKVCELGLGFQMGPPRLWNTLATGQMGPPLWLEMQTCEAAVDLFRKRNYKLPVGWRQFQQLIASALIGGHPTEYRDGLLGFEREAIHMPNGLALHYPNVRMQRDHDADRVRYVYKQRHNEWSPIYGGLATENVVQCLARIIVGKQALPIAQHYRIVSLSHDEVIYLAPASKADDALEFGLEQLRTLPEPWLEGLPLDSEGGHNRVYVK